MKTIKRTLNTKALASIFGVQNVLKQNQLLFYKVLSAILMVSVVFKMVRGWVSQLLSAISEVSLSTDETLLIIACFSFLILMVSLFSFAYMHMKLKALTAEKVAVKQEKYQEYFAGVVSTNHEDTIIKNKKQHNHTFLNKDDLFDTENRAVLLKELKNIHSFIKGAEKARLKELYLAFGFVDELRNKLESVQWVSRVEAINEVKQFGLTDFYHLVRRRLEDSNPNVRKAALSVSIDLVDNPLDILGDIKQRLSKWEEHLFVKALERMPNHRLPYFAKQINLFPAHSAFLHRMTEHFNQVPGKKEAPALQVVA